MDIVVYTDEEYRQLFGSEQADNASEWTREETDYLFELCRRFDCRFLVIADRYEFPNRERTVDELKERYYTLTKRILQYRNPLGDPHEKAFQASLSFDIGKELARKDYISRLCKRSPEAIQVILFV